MNPEELTLSCKSDNLHVRGLVLAAAPVLVLVQPGLRAHRSSPS